MPSTLSTSIVVPTYNRRERLDRVLRSLAEQDHPADEVIVVSDGSTDGTDQYLAGGTAPLPVVAASQPNQGPGAARNHGVELASAELVIFVDDDVVADPGLVGAHVAAHERLGDRVVVIGPMLTPADHQMSPWVRWEQQMLYKQYDALEAGVYAATARQFYTGNASVRRRHLVEAGGFDVTLRRAEDVELAFRLEDRGLGFAYEPHAAGLHYAERSFESWLAAAYAYGRNDVVFGRRHGQEHPGTWIAKNYRARHALVRGVTRLGVGRARTSRAATAAMRVLMTGADRAGVDAATRFALSGIYNLAYYQGVADEVGGATEFWTMLDTAPHRPEATR